MPAERVYQKASAVFGNGVTEMIGHSFVQIESGRHAKCRSQIDAIPVIRVVFG